LRGAALRSDQVLHLVFRLALCAWLSRMSVTCGLSMIGTAWLRQVVPFFFPSL